MAAPKKIDYEPKQQNRFTNIARAAGQGLLFGFGDEIEAFVTSKLDEGKSYDEVLKDIRDNIDQFRKESPTLAYGTEIVSSIPTAILGGGGLARLGLTGAGKIAAVEGAIYGAGAGEDAESRTKGALTGAALSGITGTASDKLLFKKSDLAKELQKKGIPLTPGQSLRDSGSLGSTLISALEDLSTSYPGAGAPIQAKRLESLIKTNRVLLEEAVNPLGIKIPTNLSPREAYSYVDDIISKQYDDVISNLSLKDTSNLESKILNIIEKSVLDSNDQAKALKIIDASLINRIENNTLSGKNLKNSQTNLRKRSENFSKKGGFEGEIGLVLKQVKNALEDEIDLQNSGSQQLKKLNTVYGRLMPINDAMQQAVVQEGVFTPAQIIRSIRKQDPTKRKIKLIKGEKPLLETATQAQKVLGSQFPDSGTASRLLAQDVILNPLRLGKLAPAAVASELLMSRPFGMSPVTGLLTGIDPTVRSVTPSIMSLIAREPQTQ